jgi:hypothetical protein
VDAETMIATTFAMREVAARFGGDHDVWEAFILCREGMFLDGVVH